MSLLSLALALSLAVALALCVCVCACVCVCVCVEFIKCKDRLPKYRYVCVHRDMESSFMYVL